MDVEEPDGEPVQPAMQQADEFLRVISWEKRQRYRNQAHDCLFYLDFGSRLQSWRYSWLSSWLSS